MPRPAQMTAIELKDEVKRSQAQEALAEIKKKRNGHQYKIVKIDDKTWKEVRILLRNIE